MTEALAVDDARDRALATLREAQALMRSGAITEDEYIDRFIVISRRDVDTLLTDEEREDITRVMRFACLTSPVMRVRLRLEPFPDD